ncbi:MAG: hypothetical protein MI923_13765 [Phycisphaerales bacterium]|nr:hypothetical protein [Phycisphaerales bacterium]
MDTKRRCCVGGTHGYAAVVHKPSAQPWTSASIDKYRRNSRLTRFGVCYGGLPGGVISK